MPTLYCWKKDAQACQDWVDEHAKDKVTVNGIIDKKVQCHIADVNISRLNQPPHWTEIVEKEVAAYFEKKPKGGIIMQHVLRRVFYEGENDQKDYKLGLQFVFKSELDAMSAKASLPNAFKAW